jgi:hypothetical protein
VVARAAGLAGLAVRGALGRIRARGWRPPVSRAIAARDVPKTDALRQLCRSLPGAEKPLFQWRQSRAGAFGRAKDRTDVAKIVDWYMSGKINIDDPITHKLAFDETSTRARFDACGTTIRSVVAY